MSAAGGVVTFSTRRAKPATKGDIMIPEFERRTIQLHAVKKNEYDAAHNQAFLGSYAAYHAFQEKEKKSPAKPADSPSAIARVRRREKKMLMEGDALYKAAEAAMNTWHSDHRPPDPNDSPILIIQEIAYFGEGINFKNKELIARGLTPDGGADWFRRLRDRVLNFRSLVPSVSRDPLVREIPDDPLLGIQNLREWCEEAMRPEDPRFRPSKWFDDNTTVPGNAIRQMVVAGKNVRAMDVTPGKKVYSFADVERVKGQDIMKMGHDRPT